MGWRQGFFGKAVAVVLAGLFFGVMGWIASKAMDSLVADQLARDIGVVTVWVVIVVAACLWMLFKAPALVPPTGWALPRRRVVEKPEQEERAESPSSGSLVILRALYGAGPGKEADVTGIVAGLVSGDRLVVGVGNSAFNNLDPAPSLPKTLTIAYSLDGTKSVAKFDEGTQAVLP